jgi:drug/metabolite transporter (DMT)-like permease
VRLSLTSGRAAPILALLGGASAIAFAPIFVRLTGTGPAAAGFWRLAMAMPGLLILALNAQRQPGSLRPTPLVLMAGALFALDLGFWHYGVTLSTVATSTVLANLSPVFVTAGAWLLLGERPGKRFLLGLALALAGAWMISAGTGGGAGRDPALGNALSFITALWYAAYMLAVRKARAVQGASAIMLWSSAAGAPLILAAAALLHEKLAPTSLGGWLACIGLGAVHVTGQGAIAWALGRLPAALASVVILIQPVISAVLGLVIFGEPMSALQVLGGGVALAGVALAQIAAAKAPG